MKISPNKYLIVVLIVIVLNCLVLRVESEYVVPASETITPFPTNLKILNNETGILKHGVTEIGTFTNESSSHKWLIPDIVEEQIIFFTISPKVNKTVTVFNPSEVQFDIDEDEESHVTDYLGSWTASVDGDWLIEVNDTVSGRTVDVNYTIIASIPKNGYNEVTAVQLSRSVVVANYSHAHEVHYWKVTMEYNQNGTLYLKEFISNILDEATIKIYRPGYLHNEELRETSINPFNGSFKYSWNSYYDDTFFIILKHYKAIASPIGLYNISFSEEKNSYSFETASNIPYNKSVSCRIVDSFSEAKKYYFKFQVNESRIIAFIQIHGPNSSEANILEGATVEIFDGSKQKRITEPPTLSEGAQDIDKRFNIELKNLEADTYYIVINTPSNTVGLFYIHFEYSLPTPFSWNFLSIVLSIVILLALPTYLIYLDTKGKWFQSNQWTLPLSLKESYKFIKYSFRGLFNLKEVPNDSIMIRVASIPFRTFLLLNFIESSEDETLVFSKRLRKKIEWILYFFIALVVFDAINVVFFLFSSGFMHLLPVYISNPSDLVIILSGPTVILAISVLFVNVSAYISYNQINSRINFIVQNYQDSPENGIDSQKLDPLQAVKAINYVRVLWNQAKRAFKENNFELFVIKSDAAVKSLLSTRYKQIVTGNTNPKPEFKIQVSELRRRGFDLPSDKKIAHFRNLRNRIVHSSVTLDEKESVNCFAFYSTFITRLGLRPT